MPRPRDRHRDGLGTGATPAGCCGARQVPWPLGAEKLPAGVARHTVQRGQPVRGEPSVGGDHACYVACLGLSLPQLPPLPKSLPCEKWRAKDGEVAIWLQSLSVSSHAFSRSLSRGVVYAMIE